VLEPAVPYGCFEHLTQRDDLVVQGAPRWRFPALLGFESVDAVFLHAASGDLRHAQLTEVMDQVVPDSAFVILDVFCVALSFGDDFVFAQKLLGGFLERALACDVAGAGLAAQLKKMCKDCAIVIPDGRPDQRLRQLPDFLWKNGAQGRI
jgi:hypothetical protein